MGFIIGSVSGGSGGGGGGGFFVPSASPFATTGARDTWAASNQGSLIERQTLVRTETPNQWWLYVGGSTPWIDGGPIVQGPQGTPGQAGADGQGSVEEYTAASHGFTSSDVGKPVYFNGTSWMLAQANNSSSLAIEVLEEVVDANTLRTRSAGNITLADWTQVAGAATLTPGEYYFTSQTVAGAVVTSAQLSSGYSNPIYRAVSSTEATVVTSIDSTAV